jgi:exodeoxyribonuclease VII small subunit
VSFEEEFEVVEEAVESMERGELTLDECLREYERGLNSLKNCYQILAEAQQRIEILEGQVGPVAQSGESPVWKSASELVAGGAKTIETGPVETDEQVKGE